MSHHFDYPQDETLDISDAYCLAGAGDRSGPRTVFGMNTSPTFGKPWNPAGYYELKIDTNSDYVEEVTYRATFPIGPDGTQHVQVAELTSLVDNADGKKLAALPALTKGGWAAVRRSLAIEYASVLLCRGRGSRSEDTETGAPR